MKQNKPTASNVLDNLLVAANDCMDKWDGGDIVGFKIASDCLRRKLDAARDIAKQKLWRNLK